MVPRIKNYTPHVVRVVSDDLVTVLAVFQPQPDPIRLDTREVSHILVEGLPFKDVVYGTAGTLPEPEEDTYYIVSLPTALTVSRDDFLVPYGEVRDEHGRIFACLALARVM